MPGSRLGDTVAGAQAYRAVVADAVQSDSIHQMALDRLEGCAARPIRFRPNHPPMNPGGDCASSRWLRRVAAAAGRQPDGVALVRAPPQ